MRSLKRISVKGLIGQFNHKITFPEDSNFVVLHGPNGVGKTKLLELCNAVLSGDLMYFSEVGAESCEFLFVDGSRLEMTRIDTNQSALEIELPEVTDEIPPPFLVFLTDTHGHRYEWAPRYRPEHTVPASRLRLILERDVGAINVGRNHWRLPSGEVIGTTQALRMLGRHASAREFSLNTSPEWFRDFCRETRVHLIETQRLDKYVRRHSDEHGGRHNRTTVEEFSEDLSRRISGALAENSRKSQRLDRTFPGRVIQEPPPGPEITDEIIREKYREQTVMREALEDVSILDNQSDLSLPEEGLAEWQRRMLWIYLQDADEKLATFEDLLMRTSLFREIVNSRFLNKEIILDRNRGFYFRTAVGAEIDPTKLSSGEQHELILMYDLLFNVPEDTLVLIDEPEISLHVAWQQKFLSDIERIASLRKLQFIVATHSPQIVHNWWSRTVRLGPREVEE